VLLTASNARCATLSAFNSISYRRLAAFFPSPIKPETAAGQTKPIPAASGQSGETRNLSLWAAAINSSGEQNVQSRERGSRRDSAPQETIQALGYLGWLLTQGIQHRRSHQHAKHQKTSTSRIPLNTQRRDCVP
jgi:hypothetical protein